MVLVGLAAAATVVSVMHASVALAVFVEPLEPGIDKVLWLHHQHSQRCSKSHLIALPLLPALLS